MINVPKSYITSPRTTSFKLGFNLIYGLKVSLWLSSISILFIQNEWLIPLMLAMAYRHYLDWTHPFTI